VTKPRRRGVREKAQPIVLTERDIQALVLTGLCGYVTGEQLAREFFPSADRSRRRLRQLFDAGLVRVHAVASNQAALVALTSAGLAALRARAPEAAARARLPGPINLAGIVHHVGVVDLRLYVAALGGIGGPRLLAWANAGADLAREAGFHAHRLEPDAVFDLDGEHRAGLAGGVARVAGEFDASTESGPALARKLAAYRAALADACCDELWLVAAGGPQRRAAVADIVHAAGIADRTRLFTVEDIVARPARLPPGFVGAAGRGRAEGPNPPFHDDAEAKRDHDVAANSPDADRRAARRADG